MARPRMERPSTGGVPDTIGKLVRDIRKRREMTLEQLSERTGISVSSLSRIENTRLGLTIAKIELLAQALGVSPEVFVSRDLTRDGRPAKRVPARTPPRPPRFTVDRARDRQPSLDRELSIEYLFDREDGRSLDCLHLTVQAISVWDSEFVRHPGEKIIYVIGGAAVVYCERQSPLILESGDSLYLDAQVWHSIVAVNGAPAELLVVYYQGPAGSAEPFETQFFSPERWAELPSA